MALGLWGGIAKRLYLQPQLSCQTLSEDSERRCVICWFALCRLRAGLDRGRVPCPPRRSRSPPCRGVVVCAVVLDLGPV